MKNRILCLIVSAVILTGLLVSCNTTTPQTSSAPQTTPPATTVTATATPPVSSPTSATTTMPTTTPATTPTPTTDNTVNEDLLNNLWKADKTEHWHVTVSGNKADVGKHELVEDECTVCGCMVIDTGEYVFISIDNSNYDTIFYAEYKGDSAEPDYFIETEYTYDEEMNILTHKSTNFGKQYEEGKYSYATYVEDFFGEIISFTYTYCSELTKYNEDGSKILELYNEDERVIKSTTYDAAGAIIEENSFEYTYFDDGFVKSIKKYVGERLVLETVYSSIEEGYMIIKQIVYNEDGTTTEWDVIPPTVNN